MSEVQNKEEKTPTLARVDEQPYVDHTDQDRFSVNDWNTTIRTKNKTRLMYDTDGCERLFQALN